MRDSGIDERSENSLNWRGSVDWLLSIELYGLEDFSDRQPAFQRPKLNAVETVELRE